MARRYKPKQITKGTGKLKCHACGKPVKTHEPGKPCPVYEGARRGR